jgi:hypothetical protein
MGAYRSRRAQLAPVGGSVILDIVTISGRVDAALREEYDRIEELDRLLSKIRAAESEIDDCHKEGHFDDDTVDELNSASMSIYRASPAIERRISTANLRAGWLEDRVVTINHMVNAT